MLRFQPSSYDISSTGKGVYRPIPLEGKNAKQDLRKGNEEVIWSKTPQKMFGVLISDSDDTKDGEKERIWIRQEGSRKYYGGRLKGVFNGQVQFSFEVALLQVFWFREYNNIISAHSIKILENYCKLIVNLKIFCYNLDQVLIDPSCKVCEIPVF